MKMIQKAGLTGVATLSIASALVAAPAAARAAPVRSALVAASGLRLYVAPAPGYSGPTHRDRLTCDPPPGGASRAARACGQLLAADGFVKRIPPARQACYLVYSPVRATAIGYWHGSPRLYSKVFANRCIAIRQTGGVLFAF